MPRLASDLHADGRLTLPTGSVLAPPVPGDPDRLGGMYPFAGSFQLEILELVGYGGTKEVFRGRIWPDGGEVAVSVARLDIDPTNRALIDMKRLRSFMLAMEVDHPHLVRPFAAVPIGDTLGLVEPLLHMHTFEQLIERGRALPWQRAARLMVPIFDALGALHARGLVHRDVKPSNLFLVDGPDGEPRAMLGDLDLLRREDDATPDVYPSDGERLQRVASLTLDNQVCTTAAWAAPEQAAGEAITTRADAYSAGCTLFELVAGNLPFTSRHPVTQLVERLTRTPPRLDVARPDLDFPGELVDLVAGLLQREPTARESAAGAGARLEHLLSSFVALPEP